jgi:hypothetical protein
MAAEDDTLRQLITMHDHQLGRLKEYDAYYEGEQPLSYMHPELIQQLEGQVRQVVIAWPQLVIDAVEERLDIEGFRRPKKSAADDDLWAMWQRNDMDLGSQRAHLDALVLGRSYVTVGTPDEPDDPPLICDESALDMIATTDPRTRETAAALRRWCSNGGEQAAAMADMATLYLPNATITYSKDRAGAWTEGSRDTHDLGAVPVVPILNRARRKKPFGVSEMHAVLPLADAACKIATDMMVAANYHAIPRYWATGVSEDDFTDEQGNPISVWKAVTGRIAAVEGADAKLGAFPAADLSNFHQTLASLARLVSSLYGLPPHYLGYSTENPASAEGIKSSEARLEKRAERKQRSFEDGWEEVIRLAVRIQTGKWDKDLERLETIWRDPSTPTVAQKADAALKLYTTPGGPIVPLRQTREGLGYTPTQIELMESEDEKAAAQNPAVKIASAFAGADQGAPAPAPPPVPSGALAA